MKKTYNILDLLQNIMGAKLGHLIEPSKGYWSYTGTFSVTNVSRWLLTKSKRGLERFYATPHDWTSHVGLLVQSFLSRFAGVVKGFNSHWLLTVDETVEKKAGKATYGVGYHYSSKAEKVIPSVAVFNLSLTHRLTKVSLPLLQEQLIFPTEKTEKQLAKKAAKKAQQIAKVLATKEVKKTGVTPSKRVSTGRPKGRKNKPKNEEATKNEEIAYTFQVLGGILDRFVQFLAPLVASLISIKYVVGDGGFGNNTVAKIVRAKGFELIRIWRFYWMSIMN